MNQNPSVHPWTVRLNHPVREIVIPCWVGVKLDPNQDTSQAKLKEYRAIIDTGANCCSITERVVRGLNLKPKCTTKVNTPTDKGKVANCYDIHLRLPTGTDLCQAQATESLVEGADVLIGMEVLACFNFSMVFDKEGLTVTLEEPACYHTDC